MDLTLITSGVNGHLAGEQFSYSQLCLFLDKTIDDINTKLSSNFPAFSEFTKNKANYPQYPNYNFFPDKYQRSVIFPGAAYYFYKTDEEGAAAAVEYNKEYLANLFYMQRDYSELVPEAYRLYDQGYLKDPNNTNASTFRWGNW